MQQAFLHHAQPPFPTTGQRTSTSHTPETEDTFRKQDDGRLVSWVIDKQSFKVFCRSLPAIRGPQGKQLSSQQVEAVFTEGCQSARMGDMILRSVSEEKPWDKKKEDQRRRVRHRTSGKPFLQYPQFLSACTCLAQVAFGTFEDQRSKQQERIREEVETRSQEEQILFRLLGGSTGVESGPASESCQLQLQRFSLRYVARLDCVLNAARKELRRQARCNALQGKFLRGDVQACRDAQDSFAQSLNQSLWENQSISVQEMGIDSAREILSRPSTARSCRSAASVSSNKNKDRPNETSQNERVAHRSRHRPGTAGSHGKRPVVPRSAVGMGSSSSANARRSAARVRNCVVGESYFQRPGMADVVNRRPASGVHHSTRQNWALGGSSASEAAADAGFAPSSCYMERLVLASRRPDGVVEEWQQAGAVHLPNGSSFSNKQQHLAPDQGGGTHHAASASGSARQAVLLRQQATATGETHTQVRDDSVAQDQLPAPPHNIHLGAIRGSLAVVRFDHSDSSVVRYTVWDSAGKRLGEAAKSPITVRIPASTRIELGVCISARNSSGEGQRSELVTPTICGVRCQ
jgi:hypothetical protein